MTALAYIGGQTIQGKLRAVEQAQGVVNVRLAIWLRSPSKQARADLDEALADCSDVVAQIVDGG